MLQTGRPPVQVPDKVNFFNPSNRTMALGSTQPLTEMSTRNPRYISNPLKCIVIEVTVMTVWSEVHRRKAFSSVYIDISSIIWKYVYKKY
jgi:hypothetical protein